MTFKVLDFIGQTTSFKPSTFAVPPQTTLSLGAYGLLSATPSCGGLGLTPAYYGAFLVDADAGLIVEAAVLAGLFPASGGAVADCGYVTCPSWQGGYPHPPPNSDFCNDGAGPIFENTGDFFSPGATIYLPWLHTQPTRRTNISFYNPDLTSATVSVTITSGDGTTSETSVMTVPPHAVSQINDVFASAPFEAVRAHNADTTAAASARITSNTRLYSIAWVIANLNETVAVSQPQ